MTATRAPWLWALAFAPLGCADPDELTQSAQQTIVFGEPSGAEQDGVVLLRTFPDGKESLCSASLIAPRLIVTARHCVSYLSEGVFSCSPDGEVTDNPDGGGRLGLYLPPESIEVFSGPLPRKTPLAHGEQIFSTLSSTICKNDLAFMVLDNAIDAPLIPMRLGRPAEVGELSVMVGYGLREGQKGIDYRSQPRLQKRDLKIGAVGLDSLSAGTPLVTPRTLVVSAPSGCVGDSGGPLLQQETGALLGVYSLLEGESCESAKARHHLTHVPPFEDLIMQAFAAVDSQPLPEPEPSSDDGGAGGTAGAPTTMGGAADTPTSSAGAGEPSAAPSDPEPPKDSSGCSLNATHASSTTASLPALLLALAMLGRRRRAA